MKGWLFDTNMVAELANPHGAARVQTWADQQAEEHIHLSILTIGEYEKGMHNLPSTHPLRRNIASTLSYLEHRFRGRLLPVSNEVVRRWGIMSGSVKQITRQSPPVIDTLLAATAAVHDLFLVTRNVRDVRHSGAAIFNPWEDDPAQVQIQPMRR